MGSEKNIQKLPAKRTVLIVGLVVAVLVFGVLRLGLGSSQRLSAVHVTGYGHNIAGQLGGENQAKVATIGPLTLTGDTANLEYVKVAAGSYHTLLLTSTGELYALGQNGFHTVSQSDAPSIAEPTRVSFPGLEAGETITDVDSTRDHNAALTSEGRVYTWGSNYTGQLGDGTNDTRNAPQLVRGVPKATAVSAGYRHTTVITEQGEVWAWGGSCTAAEDDKAMKAVEAASAGLSSLGGYGSTEHAALVSNDPADCTTAPSTFVQSKTPKKLHGLVGTPVEISSGYGHLLVRTQAGELYSAGCNTYGQLGRSKPEAGTSGRNDLVKVTLPGRVQRASAGYRHSVVVLAGGSAYAWGYNGPVRSLNVGSTDSAVQKPSRVKTSTRFELLDAGHDSTFGSSTAGDLVGWGQDDVQAFWSPSSEAKEIVLGERSVESNQLSVGFEHIVMVERS